MIGPRVTPPRFDLRALIAAAGLSTSPTALAWQLDVSRETVHRWLNRGVSERVADRLATRVGLWAPAVWPDLVDRVAAYRAALDRRALDPDRVERRRAADRRRQARRRARLRQEAHAA